MAKWLKNRPEVLRVLHPAFPECLDMNIGNEILPVHLDYFPLF